MAAKLLTESEMDELLKILDEDVSENENSSSPKKDLFKEIGLISEASSNIISKLNELKNTIIIINNQEQIIKDILKRLKTEINKILGEL